VDEDRAVTATRPSVLVVDDHAAFRRSVRALLATGGFDVVGEAADGDEAVRLAATTRPRLVLLDIRLPGRDGFAVAEELVRLPVPPVIVLISSHEEAVYAADVAAAPVRGFVPKDRLDCAALFRLLG
jgi:DNA-binding NarL/FixJ family response regulator